MSDDPVSPGTEIIPVVPVEIFSQILDQLGFEQRTKGRLLSTLIACSLTCTTLASLSRAQIFRAITFGPYGSREGNPHGLAILLKEKPYLANYVQRVTFIMSRLFTDHSLEPKVTGDHSDTLHEFFPNVVSFRIRPPAYYSRWGYGEHEFYEQLAQRTMDNYANNHHLYRVSIGGVAAPMWTILSRNSSLTTLVISSCSLKQWELVNVDIEDMNPGIFPRIIDLSLFDVDNLSQSMLCYFPSLAHLHIEACTDNMGAEDPAFLQRYQRRQNPALKHLKTMEISRTFPLMDVCHNATEIGTCAFPALTSLRILACDSDLDESVSSLNMILRHVTSLVDLDVVIANDHDVPLDLIQCFTACKSTLSNIVLRSYGDSFVKLNYDETHVKALCAALDAMQINNVVKTITLKLDFHMDEDWVAAVKETPSFNEWRRLKEFLLHDRALNFPKLQQLDVRVRVHYYNPSIHDESGDKDLSAGDWICGPFLLNPLDNLLAVYAHQAPYSHKPERYTYIQQIHIDF